MRTLPNGKTMGIAGNKAFDDLPDFVAVISNDGKDGWVRKEDFDEPAPRNPQEAVALMERSGPRTVPVFGEDGETVIGEWTWG